MKFYEKLIVPFFLNLCFISFLAIHKNNAETRKFFAHQHKNSSIAIEPIRFELEQIINFIVNTVPSSTIPDELSRCHKALVSTHRSVEINDLHVAVNFIIEFMNLQIDEYTTRAPRPDAPHANDGAPVGVIITCDLTQLVKLLASLQAIIVFCCNELENDFTLLFNQLTLVKTNLDSYCLLITATTEFNGTFTTLTDLQNTLTACCEQITLDFQATWTIISAGFSNTFTEISDLNSTLTTCCQEIQIDFQGVFTALNSLSTPIVCPSICAGTPITQSTIITVPGFYCLTQDITGPIIINASNVTLDLSEHTISGFGSGSGIIINAGSNRVIKNGRITNFDRGVFCTNTVTTQLFNIVINNCLIEGITSNNGTDVLLDSLIISQISGIGIHLTGNNNAYRINNILINNAQQGFIFDALSNSLIQHCSVTDCSSALSAIGYEISSGNFNQFNNCSVKNLSSSIRATGFFLLNCTNTEIIGCTVQNLLTTIGSSAEGFECADLSSNSELTRCSVLNINAPNFTAGFNLEGDSIIALDNLAQSCIASNLDGNGFVCTGTNIALTQCQAYDCPAIGFSITSTNITLQYCQSAYNATGFLINNPNSLIGNSVAVHNSSSGFESNVTGNAIYHCFASQNGINNYVAVPNVQNANTQVDNTAPTLTGPFAGVNLFM